MTEWWDAKTAIDLCRKIEAMCPSFGCHVALTGGTLYKDGRRKDVDILFYNVRQVKSMNRAGLLLALEAMGFVLTKHMGWLQKATYMGKDVDMFFPEMFPSSDQQSGHYDR